METVASGQNCERKGKEKRPQGDPNLLEVLRVVLPPTESVNVDLKLLVSLGQGGDELPNVIKLQIGLVDPVPLCRVEGGRVHNDPRETNRVHT